MEFNIKIHCEINVKLVFHEILWKKNFTVYPSLYTFYIIEGKDTLWNFSFGVFHEIQFQAHFMKHVIRLWNTFTLVSKFHCVLLSSIKNVITEKTYLLKFNSITWYLLLKKQKQKKTKPWLKNRNDKSECDNIFSELPLTDKFRHYLRMIATLYYWLYMDFYTLINYAFYITYPYNDEISIHYFIIYWFLKFTTVHVFHFYKCLFLYYAIKTIELMTR